MAILLVIAVLVIVVQGVFLALTLDENIDLDDRVRSLTKEVWKEAHEKRKLRAKIYTLETFREFYNKDIDKMLNDD